MTIATVKSRLRTTGRHAALDGLSALGRLSGRESAGLATPRVQFPYLHAVPENEEHSFRKLLGSLATTHTFVSYSEAVRRVRSGEIDRPYLALSFDDGFASNVRTARLLEEFGIVGCFFVTTGFIGTPTLTEARDFFGYSAGIDEPAMTWSDLEALKAAGHEIGNHTQTHRVVSSLSPQRVVDEIGGAADVLRARLGSVEHFAWPFGRFFHFTGDAARVVFDTGHLSCASAERGAHLSAEGASADSLCIRREHIMTSWPRRHSRYFLSRSALRGAPSAQGWPAGWEVSR